MFALCRPRTDKTDTTHSAQEWGRGTSEPTAAHAQRARRPSLSSWASHGRARSFRGMNTFSARALPALPLRAVAGRQGAVARAAYVLPSVLRRRALALVPGSHMSFRTTSRCFVRRSGSSFPLRTVFASATVEKPSASSSVPGTRAASDVASCFLAVPPSAMLLSSRCAPSLAAAPLCMRFAPFPRVPRSFKALALSEEPRRSAMCIPSESRGMYV